MAIQNKTTLKEYFNSGDRPNEAQFADLIDSSLNSTDDKATEAQAQDALIDNKYLTPKSAKKTVEKFAPVKMVNSKTPNATTGDVALAITDIPNLQTTLSGKQATLVNAGTIKSFNGISLLGSGDITLILTVKLAANFQISSITRSNVPGMSFAIATGKKYMIQILGEYRTAAAATGGSFGFILPSGTGIIKGTVEIQGPAGVEKRLINAISDSGTLANSFITSTGVASTTIPQYLEAALYFECNANGTFQLQWGSEVAGSVATLASGTVMIVTALN